MGGLLRAPGWDGVSHLGDKKVMMFIQGSRNTRRTSPQSSYYQEYRP